MISSLLQQEEIRSVKDGGGQTRKDISEIVSITFERDGDCEVGVVAQVEVELQEPHLLVNDSPDFEPELYETYIRFPRYGSQGDPELREELCRLLAVLLARELVDRGHECMVVYGVSETISFERGRTLILTQV